MWRIRHVYKHLVGSSLKRIYTEHKGKMVAWGGGGYKRMKF
jgi:hypothetical protein